MNPSYNPAWIKEAGRENPMLKDIRWIYSPPTTTSTKFTG
jgi:hypothetical protein